VSRFGRDFSHDEGLAPQSLSRSRSEIETDLASRSGRRADGGDHNDETDRGRTHDRAREREHSQSLDESDLKMLTDIGTFRALTVEDLARQRYGGDLHGAKNRLGNLSRKGLVRSRTSYPDHSVYVTLTRAGHRELTAERERHPHNQRLYHGFVKTREARHDAALYRLYHQELARIEHMGGTVRRVILDFELKQSLNRRLAKLKSLPDAEQIHHKRQIAQDHGLTVVKGKILLPDLRLEYEGPDQQLSKVDLELVTSHYRHHNLVGKAQAGFAMYAFAEDAVRLRPAMQDPEIMRDILSL
jgi:DNA-binding MarR family transcriptional regulator